MIKIFLTGLICALPLAASAALQVEMACDQSVREFFTPLVQRRLITTKPYTISTGSVNYFRTRAFAGVSAYGMQVTSVFGFTDDPLLFTPIEGEKREIYGVEVRETIANVQAQLNSVGAVNATTYRVSAALTAIACKGAIK